MSCKNIVLILGLISFIIAIFISSDVAARELTEDTNKNNEKADHTNGLEESKYGGGGGGYGGGGGGGYGGGGGGHGGGGGYRGRCYHGCCGFGRFYHRCFRCCATASEAAKYKAANPQN